MLPVLVIVVISQVFQGAAEVISLLYLLAKLYSAITACLRQ